MEGIRILEVADHTFVPAASAILADWGADVIKIEHVERGDAMRGLVKTGVIPLAGPVHVILEHSNRGKRSIGLDLTTEEGLEILYEIAKTSDVFLTNKTPSIRAKLGIDLDQIREHNPDIVYVRGTAWGARGPEADQGGYDQTSFWCRSGNAIGAQPYGADYITTMPSPAYGDSIGAMTIAGGISTALLHRERTGIADVVDVSLLGTGLWSMGAAIALSQMLDMPWRQFPPGGAYNPLVSVYRCSDDRYLCLSMLQAEKYWAETCEAIGLPELIGDPRFENQAQIMANATEGHDLFAAQFATATLDEWRERLVGFAGQWSPILDSVEVASDAQVNANGYILETRTADGTPFKLVTTPVQFNDEPSQPLRAPEFNEHGDEILADIGLDWDRIIELKVKGVVA